MRSNRAANSEAKIGDIVYIGTGHDYGLARDDFIATHIPHVSVTYNEDGSYPMFTIPCEDLDPEAEFPYVWTGKKE